MRRLMRFICSAEVREALNTPLPGEPVIVAAFAGILIGHHYL